MGQRDEDCINIHSNDDNYCPELGSRVRFKIGTNVWNNDLFREWRMPKTGWVLTVLHLHFTGFMIERSSDDTTW